MEWHQRPAQKCRLHAGGRAGSSSPPGCSRAPCVACALCRTAWLGRCLRHHAFLPPLAAWGGVRVRKTLVWCELPVFAACTVWRQGSVRSPGAPLSTWAGNSSAAMLGECLWHGTYCLYCRCSPGAWQRRQVVAGPCTPQCTTQSVSVSSMLARCCLRLRHPCWPASTSVRDCFRGCLEGLRSKATLCRAKGGHFGCAACV